MKISHKAQVLIAITALGLVATQTTATYAATKKITCYKGTTSKVVTGTNPKCPSGYTTTKPAVAPAKTTAAAPAASAKTVAFSGKYVGKMSLVWSDSGVSASAVNATGSGDISGLDALIGTGSSSPASKCDGIDGSGSLGGGGNTITVKFDTSTKGCADSDAAPTTVKLTGKAIITGGTGKFAGASGTLTVTGSFYVKSTDAGTKDSPALTLQLDGNIVTK
jgi:hypothetical protein